MKLKNKAKNLLSKSFQSYYWMGFFMADGHFSKNNRLTITLSIKDEMHLQKLIKFMGGDAHLIYYKMKFQNKFFNYCRYSVMDNYTIKLIRKKFDIDQNKTENPPSLKFYKQMKNDLFLSFLIGFIDGDGRISYQTNRKDYRIEIKVHKSWLSFLNLVKEKLEKILNIKIPKARINSDGYAFIVFSNLKICRFLKRSVIKLKLTSMERKWNKIDENRISKYEIAYNNSVLVNNLLNKGLNLTSICKKTGMTMSTAFLAKKRAIKLKLNDVLHV